MIRKIAFYSFLLIIVLILAVIITQPDWDLWARLAVGSIFFQTGHVLKQDIFSYTPNKPIWVDHEWGSGVVFYWIVKHFGDWGIFALKGLLLLAIFLLIIKIIQLNSKKNINLSILYFFLIAFSILPCVSNLLRSQIFSYLFFTLWLYILERSRRGDNKLLLILPATMLLWANMHGGFVAGIGLVLIYAIGEYLNKNNPLKYIYILIPTVLVTLINPYGINYWHYIYEATTMLRSSIPEWQPITLKGPFHYIGPLKIHVLSGFMLFLLMTTVVSIKSLINKSKTDWIRILLVGITLYFGIKHQRHTIFFIIVISSLFYEHFINLFSWITKAIKAKFNDRLSGIASYIPDSLCCLLIIIICLKVFPMVSFDIQTKPYIYPIGSIEFIKQNNLKGNLAVTYGWGSFTFWKLYPQCKVLFDGRYEEVYPNDVYDIAMDFSDHRNDKWDRFLKLYKTDIILLPKKKYTAYDVARLKDWVPVYQDLISIVLLPKNKVMGTVVIPNPESEVYWHQDLSREINIK